MRIVMIGPFGLRPKGTMSVRALPLAKALVARGHRVDILMPPWSCPQDSGREWEEDGVGIHNITLPPRLPLLWHLIVTWLLMRRALALRPDVIHCFKPKGYAGLAAMAFWFLRRLTKTRLVVDSDDWEGRGGWNEVEPYTGLQRRFFAWQERWGLTHCDALTVASRALETIVWSLGVAPSKVFYVPNGVLRERMAGGRGAGEQRSEEVRQGLRSTQAPGSVHKAPLGLGLTGRRPLYAEPGGFSPGRGDDEKSPPLLRKRALRPTVLLYTRFFEFQVERVVGVFQRVLAEVPEAKLLVVGRGFFGEEERLRELMQEAGMAHCLIYADWVEPEELPAYFAAADVAIYPYDDTLINRTKCAVKLIDLMAAGVPVVADDVGQNGEYIEHGISGLLVPPGETDTFASSVVKLLRDESLRAKLGRGAQKRVFEEFDWGKLAVRVEEAYRGAKDR